MLETSARRNKSSIETPEELGWAFLTKGLANESYTMLFIDMMIYFSIQVLTQLAIKGSPKQRIDSIKEELAEWTFCHTCRALGVHIGHNACGLKDGAHVEKGCTHCRKPVPDEYIVQLRLLK